MNMNINTYRKIVTVNYEDSNYLRLKNIDTKPGNFYVLGERGTGQSRNLEYSLDGVNWNVYVWSFYQKGPHGVAGAGSILYTPVRVNPGQNIYLRGINSAWGEPNILKKLYMDVSFEVGGSPLSLLDYTDMESITTLPTRALCTGDSLREQGMGLFSGITNLKSASKMTFLNVTTIGERALAEMFYRCSNLVDYPDTSKFTTINNEGLSGMFYNTKITSMPDLTNVVTVGNKGMQYIFSGCTSLNGDIDLSSVTTVGSYGLREAFKGCTSLNGDIDLSSVTTVDQYGLHQTFMNCTSLNGDIDFSSLTTLYSRGLGETFMNCTSLTTAPELSVTSVNGNEPFRQTFAGCTSLTTAPSTLPATTLTPTCYFAMFNGCTSLTTAPILPATTLDSNCYESMFNGCTSLTTAPTLPATTLVGKCYFNMFRGCTSLNKVVTYAQDISATDCLLTWMNNVSPTGDFYNLGGATYPSGESGIPSGWTEHNSL